jgi:hypothetical protein
MDKGKSVDPTYFEQTDVVTFIYHFLKVPPKPILRADGKVVFRFDVDITEALEKFYLNERVPIQDFCQKLKTVRSMIFSIKGGHRA